MKWRKEKIGGAQPSDREPSLPNGLLFKLNRACHWTPLVVTVTAMAAVSNQGSPASFWATVGLNTNGCLRKRKLPPVLSISGDFPGENRWTWWCIVQQYHYFQPGGIVAPQGDQAVASFHPARFMPVKINSAIATWTKNIFGVLDHPGVFFATAKNWQKQWNKKQQTPQTGSKWFMFLALDLFSPPIPTRRFRIYAFI